MRKEPDRVLDLSHIPIVKTLPADWYDPAEDAEWESYLDDECKKKVA